MRNYLCMFFLLFSLGASAQTITGRLVNRNKEPVFGVAVILQHMDSTYLDATATGIDGRFIFSSDVRPYRLLFQHISYKPLIVEASESELGDIILSESSTELEEVVVKGERPTVKVEEGKLSYNLKTIADRRMADNAFEAIAKLPGVRETDGVLSLTGATSLTVIINGKPATMTQEQVGQLLKSTPVERIEKAEVVYNAPPQWHIKGAAINIVLKRETDNTLQGYVFGNWSDNTRSRYNAGGNLYYGSSKISLNMMYSYINSDDRSKLDQWSYHKTKNTITDIHTVTESENITRSHNAYLDLNYRISPESNASLSYIGEYVPHSSSSSPSIDNYFGKSISGEKGDNYLHHLVFSYVSPFGLATGVDYTYYKTQALQTMSYAGVNEVYKRAFDYYTLQTIDQISAYADMLHSFNKNWKLKYGLKYQFVKNANSQRYNEEKEIVSHTREHTGDLYVSFSKSWQEGRVLLDITLKGEYYKINEYTQWSPMPNASLSYQITDDHYLQLAYQSLRVYPSYWELQDYTSYSNPYVVMYGNPRLRPAKYNVANFLYMLKNKYIFQLSYYIIKDFFFQQAYQSPEELKMLYQTINLDYTSSLNFTTVIPFSLGKVLNSQLTVTAYNERYKSKEWYDLSFDRNKWAGIIGLDNTFRLSSKPKVAFILYAGYKTPTIQGIWDLSACWFLDTGVSGSFARDRISVSLRCKNMLGKVSSSKITTDYKGQDYTMDMRFFNRRFFFTISYKFGGYTSREQKDIDTSRFGK